MFNLQQAIALSQVKNIKKMPYLGHKHDGFKNNDKIIQIVLNIFWVRW